MDGLSGGGYKEVYDKKINAFKEKLYVVNLYLWIGLLTLKMTSGKAKECKFF
jgi:hypothetical protein